MPTNELHDLLFDNPAVEEVQALIDKYPNAVRETDDYGDLPLHFAVAEGVSLEVVQLLIKEYPDAVKEKDQDGNMLLSLPEIKEIYDRVVTVVQLMRSKGLRGDHAEGEDLLGVKEEAQAIADTIAFKDLQPPFVVGILGGWGSGKSFTFNLINEYLKEIQGYDLTIDVVKHDFPYVGHFYPIEFDVWTYAKGILWAGLMNRILTALNDQLDLEKVIGSELLMKGVSVIELMDQFTTSGEIKYLKEAIKEDSVQKALRGWKPSDGKITKALIHATNSNYEKEVEDLAEKMEKLHRYLALEEVTAEKNTKIQPEIKQIFKEAYKQYTKEHPGEIPQTMDAMMENLDRWKGMFGRLKRYRDILRAGRLKPLWVTVFLSSFIIAVALPLVLDKVGAAVTALGPFLSGIFVKLNNAREEWMSAKAEFAKVASELHLDKEKFQKAMEAANEAQSGSDTNDEENQQDNIAMLNAEINTLKDRIWLREGDSLNKVVRDRLGSSNYEEHLGVVHQAQADLKLISDAMLRRDSNEEDAAKKIFPRGDPRIVLFIDDLDRCPPKKVVETLEAVQLLVKTKLFVVVLAIDAQYVTLCLEKEYEDILRPERHPSGLDYIEKIVQIPYRVPPISAEYMEKYLQAQMNAKKKDTRKPSESEEVSDTSQSESQAQEPSPFDIVTDVASSDGETPTTADEPSEPEAVPIPTEELEFTWEELQSLKSACVFSGVLPRSAKRLVNVFKLMKIIWYRRDQTPGVDTPYEVSMREACVLMLALCASNSKSVRKEMCKVLAKIETATSMPADGNLKSFIENTLGEIELEQVDDSPLTMIYDEKCNGIFEKVKWNNGKEWNLVKKDLRLLRSFSFVGEHNKRVEDK